MIKEPMLITLTLEEYEELLDDSRFLDCLRIAGVDEWDGWDDACDIYRELDEDQ